MAAARQQLEMRCDDVNWKTALTVSRLVLHQKDSKFRQAAVLQWLEKHTEFQEVQKTH